MLEKAAKDIEDERMKRIEEDRRLTTLIPKNKEADCSTEEPTQQKCDKEKKKGISGLRVMGICWM